MNSYEINDAWLEQLEVNVNVFLDYLQRQDGDTINIGEAKFVFAPIQGHVNRLDTIRKYKGAKV